MNVRSMPPHRVRSGVRSSASIGRSVHRNPSSAVTVPQSKRNREWNRHAGHAAVRRPAAAIGRIGGACRRPRGAAFAPTRSDDPKARAAADAYRFEWSEGGAAASDNARARPNGKCASGAIRSTRTQYPSRWNRDPSRARPGRENRTLHARMRPTPTTRARRRRSNPFTPDTNRRP